MNWLRVLGLINFAMALVICPTLGQAATVAANSCSDLFVAHFPGSIRVTSDTIAFSNDYRTRKGIQGDVRLHYTQFEMYHLGEEVPFSTHKNIVRDELTPQILPGVKPLSTNRAALKHLLHDPGLYAIYANYGDRVSTEVVSLVQTVERSLPLRRQTTYLVNGLGNGTTLGKAPILGFMRVFDGSRSGLATRRPSLLPLERILTAMGKSTAAVKQLRAQGNDVLEIGKYYLNDDLSAGDLQLVRRSTLAWLRRSLLSRAGKNLETTYYFTHVVSRVHQIAYQRTYGFTSAPRELSTNLAIDENVMVIRADQLLARLNQILDPAN